MKPGLRIVNVCWLRRRNIGDRDATAEQLLNKVMTLQLKLEEKMFAESMMARARRHTTDEMPPSEGFILPETLVLADASCAAGAICAGGAIL